LVRLQARIVGAMQHVDASMVLNEVPMLADYSRRQQASRVMQCLQRAVPDVGQAGCESSAEITQKEVDTPPSLAPTCRAGDGGGR